MVKIGLTSVAILLLLSTPVLAFHCPKDIKAINTALARSTLSATTQSKVKKLRDEGEALHKAGKHKEATDKLSEAMRMLLAEK